MIGVYICIILLLILDQAVKAWTVANIALNTGQSFIPNIMSLFYIRNTGAAWGVLSGNMIFFFIVTIVICIGLMIWIHRKKHRKIEYIAYIFIFSGAIGNFIDRIRLGYVVDMFRLEFIDFPIFNVADVCLTVGVGLMVIDALWHEWRPKGEKHV